MTRSTGILLAVIVLTLIGTGVYFASATEPEPVAEETTALQTETETETDSLTETSAEEAAQDDLPPAEPVIDDTQTVSTDILPDTVVERVEYNLPRGHLGVLSVVVETDEAGLVQSLEYEHQDVEPESVPHHNQFDQAFEASDYVGQSLEDIEDVFISGASFTSAAFNTAIENLQNR